MLASLRKFHKDLSLLRKEVSLIKANSISKVSIRQQAEDLGSQCFSEFSETLLNESDISPDLVEIYSQQFGRLIKISAPSNLKKSYTDTLSAVLKTFRKDLILPLQTNPKKSVKATLLSKVLDTLPLPEESDYLKEAIECAHHNFYRASVILGWCAAIDRIHKIIEYGGFPRFNITSSSMASLSTGRFKRFNSVQNVSSISELREVFDTIIIWIIEGMEFIDSNQHTRLRSCFDMRCQCAHPGDAPITQYNLLSFFSDLNEIIFKNEKFIIKHSPQ